MKNEYNAVSKNLWMSYDNDEGFTNFPIIFIVSQTDMRRLTYTRTKEKQKKNKRKKR
jgi:hypothetical protein